MANGITPFLLQTSKSTCNYFTSPNYQDNGQYEVIITTSIAQGNRYLLRYSDIYTIPNSDFWQYRKSTPAPEIKLTGPGGRMPIGLPQKTTSL